MAAVLEYVTAECLELAGAECLQAKNKLIQPKHLNLALRADAELGQSLAGCTLTTSSVPLNVHEALARKGKDAKK